MKRESKWGYGWRGCSPVRHPADGFTVTGLQRCKYRQPPCGGVHPSAGRRTASPSLSFSPANRKQEPCSAWYFTFRYPFESKLSTATSKQKPPSGDSCFLLDQWSWRESNPRPVKVTICFLHAYPVLIVGRDEVSGNRIFPYLLYFIVRPEKPSDNP